MRRPRRGWSWDAQREAVYGVIAVMMGLSLGIGLRAVATVAAGEGATRGGQPAFALVVGGLLLVFGDALLARRRAHAALVLYPLALIAGFALMGAF